MEILDLYDKNRTKTDKKIIRGEKVPEGLYRLVVHCCIFNSKNEMLIQQRVSTKKWPNKWDITAGGCVQTMETSSLAMKRELLEEIGIEMDFSNIRQTFTFNFNEGFDDFYLINKDIDLNNVHLQKEEVQAVKWASCEEILTMIENNQFIPYHKNLIKLLFEMRINLDIYDE